MRTRTHTLILLLGFACVLAACGRLGVELFAVRDAAATQPKPDAGTTLDAGRDSGVYVGPDAGRVDAGRVDAGRVDAGRVDAGCQSVCSVEHGSVDCRSGTCQISCETDYADCDGSAANGCEANLSASASSCGACAVACVNANGTTSCVAGACAPVCATGYADCDGRAQNGCETRISADVSNCGGCGVACDTSFQTCTQGSCQVSMCPAGFGDCDAVSSDCETDLTSSVTHCGACDNACVASNATPRCSGSTCGIASCNGGFADCDLSAANGCESVPATDAANCGGCGTVCSNAHGTTSCASGVCVPACSSGWGSCDSNVQNGCETALTTTSNCGGCGTVCPNTIAGATAVCSSGSCGYNCNSLSGVYALRITSSASWAQTNYIAAGSGTLQFWLRLTLTQSGTSLTGNAELCDQVTPEERNTVTTDRYILSYPSALFTPGAPAVAFSATLASLAPGAGLTSARAAHLLGITMSDPLNGAWPALATARANQADHDVDGEVGVTVVFVDDATYNHAQTDSTLFAARASHAYGAQRLRFSLAGALTGCTGASGAATVQSFDTRTIGCRLESGTDCNSTQYTYVDSNTIAYDIGSSTYTLTRLGATGTTFSCAQVRAAL